MSVKFKLSDLHIRKQNGTFGDLTALKGDRGLTAVQVSGTQPTDPDIDVWFKDQQSAPVMVYTTDEINDMIASAETSPTQAAHHVGEYIICVINDQAKLYKVTAEISAQETLTPGGNIRAVTVADMQPVPSSTSAVQYTKLSSALTINGIYATEYGKLLFLGLNFNVSANIDHNTPLVRIMGLGHPFVSNDPTTVFCTNAHTAMLRPKTDDDRVNFVLCANGAISADNYYQGTMIIIRA